MKAFRYEWVEKQTKKVISGLLRSDLYDKYYFEDFFEEFMERFNNELPVPPRCHFSDYDFKTKSFFTQDGRDKFYRAIQKFNEKFTKEETDIELIEIVVPLEELNVVYKDDYQFLAAE